MSPFRTNLIATLTGIDDGVSVDHIAYLSAQFPRVEWGILLGRSETPRYPPLEFVKSWAKIQESRHIPMAMHLCGSYAKRWLAEDAEIVDLAAMFPRIQLNIVASRVDIPKLCRQIGSLHTNVITQHYEGNATITKALAGNPHHSVLFDASGGRGMAPPDWPQALDGVRCGYAGGLGPDNVAAQLQLIEQVSQDTSWIDMEGRIRTSDDRLDLSLCKKVLEDVEIYCAQPHVPSPRL